MADILKVFTAEQLIELYRQYLLSKNTGLTDFNEGSKTKALIESNSEIISTISMDFKEGLTKAIPIALYQGFGFARLGAVNANGFIRPYREPLFTIEYTGVGTSALITSTTAIMSATVTGAPSDAFSLDYATYPTVDDLVAAIDALTNWSATVVSTKGTIDSEDIFQYTNKEAVAATNYLMTDGLDIMNNDAILITVTEGFSVSVDDLIISTTEEKTIAAGESGVQCPAEVNETGVIGNIGAGSINTKLAKGSIASAIDGIEQCINDSAFSGGSEKETAAQRQVRFAQTVNSLNAGTKEGILSEIRKVTGVRSVGMRTSFPFRGTNTIVVDDGSGTLSAALRAAVETALYGDPNDLLTWPGKNAEGIGYNIVAPDIIDVDIAVNVFRLATVNVELATIELTVKNAIEQYVNTRQLGENVLLSEIIRVGKNSTAAAHDFVIVSPSANIVIPDTGFAKTGAGTEGSVTVTGSVL